MLTLKEFLTTLNCCAEQHDSSEHARTVEQMPVWKNGAHGWKMQEREKMTNNASAVSQDEDLHATVLPPPPEPWMPPKQPAAAEKVQPTIEDTPPAPAWYTILCCSSAQDRFSGPSVSPRTYFIAVDRSGGASVGLAFDVLDESRCVISQVKPEGLIADWNKTASPSQVVSPGDHISEINGISGNGREIASKLMDWSSKMRLTIHRPQMINVKLAKKGKMLGVSMAAHDAAKSDEDTGTSTKMLLITAVYPNGAVKSWNDESANKVKVAAGDRIVSVNGLTDQQTMLQTLKTSEELDMHIMSWKLNGS